MRRWLFIPATLVSAVAMGQTLLVRTPAGTTAEVRGTRSGDINGSPTFVAPNIYTTGPNDDPRFMTHGDFNGDKFEDIAISAAGMGAVSIWLNVNGTGRFRFGGYYPADAVGIRGIVAADLDGDGKLDIVTANTSTNLVSVLMGNGDGTFKPAVTYPTGLTGSYAVSAFYIGTQTVLSLAVGSQTAGVGISVIPGIGDGGFLAPSVYLGADGGPGVQGAFATTGPVVPWDINGDGLLDLVTGDSATDGVWTARWLGLPDGGFSPALELRQSGIPLLPQGANGHVHFALPWDCNNDSVMDIAIVASKGFIVSPGSVTLGYVVGGGNVSSNLDMSFGDISARRFAEPDKSAIDKIALGDFNGDGNTDVAVSIDDSSNVSNGVMVFLGDGNCRLSAPFYLPISTALPAAQFPFAMTAADFNGDGVTDLAVATEFSLPDRLYVWLSNGPPTQVNITGTPTVNVANQPVPVPLRSMNPPTVLTFGASTAQFVTGCQPSSCWNILCNYPAEYSTTFAIDAGAFVSPANGLEVPARGGGVLGQYGWEKDVCLTSPYSTAGDYMSETIIELVSAADGGICKVAQHKNYQQNN